MLRKIFLLILVAYNISCQNIHDLKRIESDDYSILYPNNLKLDDRNSDEVDFVLLSKKENDDDLFI